MLSLQQSMHMISTVLIKACVSLHCCITGCCYLNFLEDLKTSSFLVWLKGLNFKYVWNAIIWYSKKALLMFFTTPLPIRLLLGLISCQPLALNLRINRIVFRKAVTDVKDSWIHWAAWSDIVLLPDRFICTAHSQDGSATFKLAGSKAKRLTLKGGAWLSGTFIA